MAEVKWERIGDFRGVVNPALDSSDLRNVLQNISARLSAGDAELLQAGRHRTVRLKFPDQLDVVVKSFGHQPPLKDIADRICGSKAYRTYVAASAMKFAGVGTIPPVACLERWKGFRLVESHFISLFLDDTECFKDKLVEYWERHADYAEFNALMKLVAAGVRGLHDAGCIHNDLGNQNIELARDGGTGSYTRCIFLDLNRSRCGHPLSVAARAKDMARLWLPSGFYQVFFDYYWNNAVPTLFWFFRYYYYALFRLHTCSRTVRHPLREMRYKLHPELAPQSAGYPGMRNQWVWDNAHFEPSRTLSRFDEHALARYVDRSRKLKRHCLDLNAVFAAKNGRRHEQITGICDSASPKRLRIGVDGFVENFERDAKLLNRLGVRRVLVRISATEQHDIIALRQAGVQKFLDNGFGVAIQLIQSRDAITDVCGWTGFCRTTLSHFLSRLDYVTCGEGFNVIRSGVLCDTDYDTFILPALDTLMLDHHPPVVAATVDVTHDSKAAPLSVCTDAKEMRKFGYDSVSFKWRTGKAESDDELRSALDYFRGHFASDDRSLLPVRLLLEHPVNLPNATETFMRDITTALYYGNVAEVALWSLCGDIYGLADTDGVPRDTFTALNSWLHHTLIDK